MPPAPNRVYVHRAMANARDNFFRVPELSPGSARSQRLLTNIGTYLRGEFSIHKIGSKVDCRTKSPNIEDSIVILSTDFRKLLSVGELAFDIIIVQEFDAIVVFVSLIKMGQVGSIFDTELVRRQKN